MLCLVIAFVNLIGTLAIGASFLGPFIWISFFALQSYFLTGHSLSRGTCLSLLTSFFLGLIWGQVSNWLWHHFFESLSFLEMNLIDGGLLVFFLATGALSCVNRSFCNSLPATFTGLTVTVLLWGRPLPFLGSGLLGESTIFPGMLIAVFMYGYGLLLAYLMDLIYLTIAKPSLKSKKNVTDND